MDYILFSEQQLIAAARAIMAAGRGDVAESIYRQIIMPGTGIEADRNIAIADFVYAAAPRRYKEEWYAVALFRGTSKYLHPGAGKDEYAAYLLEQAGISKAHTYALTDLSVTDREVGAYTDLALAIKYAEMHTDENGRHLCPEEQKSRGEMPRGEHKRRLELLYVLKSRNKLGRYENILIREINGECHDRERKKRTSEPTAAQQIQFAP